MRLVLVILLVGGWFAASAARAAETSRNILILNSYRPGYGWTRDQNQAIRDALENDPGDVVFWTEFLDAARVFDAAYFDEFERLLRVKHRDRTFALVMVTDDDATRFMIERGERLAPTVPVVFSGVTNQENLQAAPRERFTGVVEIFDSLAIFELARALHPQARRAYLVTDDSLTARGMRDDYRRIRRTSAGPEIEFLDVSERPLSEVFAALDPPPEPGFIITSSFRGDGARDLPSGRDVVRRLAEISELPVYSPIMSDVGGGLLAGSSNNGYHHGRIAARLATRVLRGARTSEIPIEIDSVNHFLFDHGEMRKWGIEEAALPPTAVVLNRPDSFFHRYRAWIGAGLLFLGAQTAVIAALILSVVRYRRGRRELERGERRYQGLITQSREGVWRVAFDEPIPKSGPGRDPAALLARGRIAECNHAAAALVGEADPAALLGRSGVEIFGALDAAAARLVLRAAREGDGQDVETTRDGRHFAHSLTGIVEDGRLTQIWGVTRDVTERQRAEESARLAERRYHDLLETVRIVAVILDAEGRITFCNDFCRKVVGRPRAEIIGTSWRDHVQGARGRRSLSESRFTALLEGPSSGQLELSIRSGDGRLLLIECDYTLLRDREGTPAGAAVLGRDVTEQRALEDDYRQAQKLESIGRLAGGVAHDFNNLLTVINGYADLAIGEVDDQAPVKEYLSEARRAGERAAGLTQQLLAFSRKQVLRPRVLDLNAVVGENERLLRRIIGEDVSLGVSLETGLPCVKADKSQLHQILLNLAVNARDAMPAGGALSIRTFRGAGDKESALSSETSPFGWVGFEVSDTGFGMSAEVKERLFEPFFTTKGPGKGTGLGLPTVYGIVSQMGGRIAVSSSPGEGATFRILLPASPDQPELESRTAAAVRVKGEGVILVVEDQPDVRALTATVLREAGFEVIEAEDGPSALEIHRREGGRIDLLLTDVIMAGMTGPELAQRIRAEAPGAAVLYMSGYADRDVVGELAEGTLIHKPFTPEILVDEVHRFLAAERARRAESRNPPGTS